MAKRSWHSFLGARSQSFVKALVEDAREIPPADLVAMKTYRLEERKEACGGHDPIRVLLAYAQDDLVYDENGNVVPMKNRADYEALSRELKLNKFGLAYRPGANFWLHRTLADIVIGAAIHLYWAQGWTTTLYDGLRTMEGAYNLYVFAPDADIEAGLLALPGQSAHNKGLAVDSMMEDKQGREVDMGGHFDHLDMATNSRVYDGDGISKEAHHNRLIREAAFLRSAFTQGLLVAPLRSEFWDDRLPENRQDLWRVLDSAARCIGLKLLNQQDETWRKTDRAAFRKRWEDWSYEDFLKRWEETFKGQEALLQEAFGVTTPPLKEKAEFYHGNYHPIYDERLVGSGKHLIQAIIGGA